MPLQRPRQLPPFTERTETPLVSPAPALDYERIKVKVLDIQFDLLNAHKHLDEYIEKLAANIKEKGLINEPLVRLDPQNRRYLLIAGEARVRAMIRLGWEDTYVRCLKGAFTEQQLRDLALVDNLLKEEIDPLAFGLYAKDEMARSGRSARELAAVLSNKVSASTITRYAALLNNLTPDLIDLIRTNHLPPAAARLLTGKGLDDEAKRHFAALYCNRKIRTTDDLAAAIRSFKSGNAQAAAPAGAFTCEEEGCKITVNLPPGGSLTAAETALKIVLDDLRKHGGKRGIDSWKAFLTKKKAHARKAAELKTAQDVLSRHGSDGNPGS